MRALLLVAAFTLSAFGQVVARPGDNLHERLVEAELGPGILILSRGVYRIDEPLAITSSIVVTGAGREATWLAPSPDFVGDAVIELVGSATGNLRGVTLQSFGILSLSKSPTVRCGVLIARDGNRYASSFHSLSDIQVQGRYGIGFALIGAECCRLDNCSASSQGMSGGIGLYGSHADALDIRASRLGGRTFAGGTCTYNTFTGGSYSPGSGGYCVLLDGSVGNWSMDGVYFGSASGAEAVVRLHGTGSMYSVYIPTQIVMTGCGNDTSLSKFGVKVTSDRLDGGGAAWCSWVGCTFMSTSDPLRCDGLLLHSYTTGCRWLRSGVSEEVLP